MHKKPNLWILGLLFILAVIAIPVIYFLPKEAKAKDTPWDKVPVRNPHVDHSDILQGPFETGEEVTARCLECHEDAAFQVMQTVHWTWESKPYDLDRLDEPVTIGKKNTLNNFCIGIQSNWTGCTRCHAGYGWEDESFDFSVPEKVDCLVCHDDSGAYVKSAAGQPAEGVDLLVSAQSVATPSRVNCGNCHFQGGGGNGVKHGDLDSHLFFPAEDVDVHMGRHNFVCVDCHQTNDHNIGGRAASVSLDNDNQIYCTDCHKVNLHQDDRINAHVQSVACQTCHIPEGAIKDPTKMEWDWSTAGQDIDEGPHTYLKIKGSFIYESNFMPEYRWFSGVADRYLFGDEIDPATATEMNPLKGDITDADAKIFPFKIHYAKQPYDVNYKTILQPKTVGEGGYWTEFDWDLALQLGSEAAGMEYSGEYGFAETIMYWPITHLVQPKENVLQCVACHSDEGRLDWQLLGYPGDPIEWSGRAKLTEMP